jgi:hypothetical protein
MKKFFFLILYCIGVLIIALIVFNKFYLQKKLDTYKIQVDLINKLNSQIKTLHHVREFKYLENNEINTLILKQRIPSKHNKEILFQGDSWAEQNIIYKNSSNFLDKFSQENSISILDAGTSSYSFSLMSSQLKYLKEHFKINPDVIVSIIDHTDFADEICRYKSKIVFKNNQIKSIYPEHDDSGEIYNYNLRHMSKMKKILNMENNFFKNFFFISEIIKLKFKKNKRKCSLKNIVSLLNTKELDFEKNLLYFKKIANLYLDEVFLENKNIQLILVIHPWLLHENFNNFYFANAFEEVISKRKEYKNIHLLNFQLEYPDLYIKNKIKLNEIHVPDDVTSHLTPNAHLVFLKNILQFVKQFI